MVLPRLASLPVLRLALASALALAAVACSHAKPTTDPGSEVKPDDPSGDSASSSAAATDGTAGAAPAEKDTASSSAPSSAPAPKSSAPGAKTTPATPGTQTPKADPAAPIPGAVPIPGAAGGGGAGNVDVAAQLTTTLAGVVFVSEAEFPWSVLQADATDVTDITPSVVADRFGAMIAQLDGGEGRDLSQLRVVADEEGYAAFFEDLASDPSDPAGPKYVSAEGLVAANLQGTQVFFFDMSRSGNQVTGPIITVIVGKTTANKLVAMVSFQVAT
jgi:hypothetical protein